jgi:hypothetical protein
MPAIERTALKTVLREECLPALAQATPYFSLADVRTWLGRRRRPAPPATLRRYLHEALSDGQIHDAGRGWYSPLEKPFALNREPVRAFVTSLQKRFPLLEFTCWSTEQIAGFGHHQLARFVVFVHAERDTMESVANTLRDAGWSAWLNPTQQEAAKGFRTEDKTVVVRPTVSRAPAENGFAAIEKILVDLRVEAGALKFFDLGEYRRLVVNLAGRNRISVGALTGYARRRGVKLEAVLGGLINQGQIKR